MKKVTDMVSSIAIVCPVLKETDKFFPDFSSHLRLRVITTLKARLCDGSHLRGTINRVYMSCVTDYIRRVKNPHLGRDTNASKLCHV